MGAQHSYLTDIFTRYGILETRNLWRMKQFYEAYRKYPKLSTLLRELGWSSHLYVLSKSKTIEEKEFYIRLAIKEKYSVRELERQIDSGYYERAMISKEIHLGNIAKQKRRGVRNALHNSFA